MVPIPTGQRIAKVNVKFGNGWMGKNAGIRRLNFADNGEPGGILVIITISDLPPPPPPPPPRQQFWEKKY